ncbi:delta-12 fatty acid desaturase [Helicostylum pulchrum]|nr:delta-12 fatty acid desaturase [Helicostylum pulchrum]
MKEIRDAIPSYCFKRNTLRSFYYDFHDLACILILGTLSGYINKAPNIYARAILRCIYWISQSTIWFGIWTLGHECGHRVFNPIKSINNTVGFVLHSAILTPYSWRFIHAKHHKNTGHMVREQSHIPTLRSETKLPPRNQDLDPDGDHSIFDESSLATFCVLAYTLVIGFPVPRCGAYKETQYWDVILSTVGVSTTLIIVIYCGYKFGWTTAAKHYIIPYSGYYDWLVLVAYLHHTDPKIPHYCDGVFNFQRGAALTIDRSYGFLINYSHHHISHSLLGRHYLCFDTPIAATLWNNWRACRFVEDEGDVVFYKR